MNELTQEEITHTYTAAMDSVNLINAGKPVDMSVAEWTDTLKRNKDHLLIILQKPFWATEDLTPFTLASV